MLRSTPLKRKTPLKRTRMKRSRPKPNRAGSDPAHLAWIRTLPCCACHNDFKGNIAAHHSTVGRGLSQKTSDRETMPLCHWCHRDFHAARGLFDGWKRARRTAWQNEMVTLYAPGEQTV